MSDAKKIREERRFTTTLIHSGEPQVLGFVKRLREDLGNLDLDVAFGEFNQELDGHDHHPPSESRSWRLVVTDEMGNSHEFAGKTVATESDGGILTASYMIIDERRHDFDHVEETARCINLAFGPAPWAPVEPSPGT